MQSVVFQDLLLPAVFDFFALRRVEECMQLIGDRGSHAQPMTRCTGREGMSQLIGSPLRRGLGAAMQCDRCSCGSGTPLEPSAALTSLSASVDSGSASPERLGRPGAGGRPALWKLSGSAALVGCWQMATDGGTNDLNT